MVIDMKEGYLIILFPEDEKYCVQKFYQLGEIKEPNSSCKLREGRWGVVVLLWHE